MSVVGVLLVVGLIGGGVLLRGRMRFGGGRSVRSELNRMVSEGWRYEQEHRDAEALDVFEEIKRRDPRYVLAYIKTSSIRLRLGDLGGALEDVNAGLLLDPKRKELWDTKGDVLARMGRVTEAIECYRKEIELKPSGYWEPWIKLGDAYQKTNQDELARKAYRDVLELYPGFQKAQQRLEAVSSEGQSSAKDATKSK